MPQYLQPSSLVCNVYVLCVKGGSTVHYSLNEQKISLRVVSVNMEEVLLIIVIAAVHSDAYVHYSS